MEYLFVKAFIFRVPENYLKFPALFASSAVLYTLIQLISCSLSRHRCPSLGERFVLARGISFTIPNLSRY